MPQGPGGGQRRPKTGGGRGGALRLCSNKVQRGCTRRWLKPPGPSLREAPRSPRRSVKSTDTDRVKDAQLANSNPRRRWQASVRACPSSRSDRPGRSQRGRAAARTQPAPRAEWAEFADKLHLRDSTMTFSRNMREYMRTRKVYCELRLFA